MGFMFERFNFFTLFRVVGNVKERFYKGKLRKVGRIKMECFGVCFPHNIFELSGFGDFRGYKCPRRTATASGNTVLIDQGDV